MTKPVSGEPIIVRDMKTSAALSTEDRRAWFAARVSEARDEHGVTFARFSHHPEDPAWLLFEGWVEQPKRQGQLRFPARATRPVEVSAPKRRIT